MIQGDTIKLTAQSVHMEGEARLDTGGRGLIWTSVGNAGLDATGAGLGGGHGGYGGGADIMNYTQG